MKRTQVSPGAPSLVFILDAQFTTAGALCGRHDPTRRYLFWSRQEAEEAVRDISKEPGLHSLHLRPSQLVIGEEGDAWFFDVLNNTTAAGRAAS